MSTPTIPAPVKPYALSFAGPNIEATLVPAGSTHRIEAASILVNLSPRPLRIDQESPPIRPWRSTTLSRAEVRSDGPVAVLRVKEVDNIGRLTLNREWRPLGQTLPDNSEFPRDTPLWISPQDEIGAVDVDRRHFTGEIAVPEQPEPFLLKLNLWYAPPYTDCFIHTGHKFLEVHTQIHGTGRMQKFRKQDASTLFEEVQMPPGFTHESFAVVDGDVWRYPWHRYYADADCIWMAIELHRSTPAS